MVVEHVPGLQYKESAKWISYVTNINEHVSVNAVEPVNSPGKTP